MNLKLCENVKINTYSNYFLPKESFDKFIKLNESGYDMYNINDSFYNDLFPTFKSKDRTDILLRDRKKGLL